MASSPSFLPSFYSAVLCLALSSSLGCKLAGKVPGIKLRQDNTLPGRKEAPFHAMYLLCRKIKPFPAAPQQSPLTFHWPECHPVFSPKPSTGNGTTNTLDELGFTPEMNGGGGRNHHLNKIRALWARQKGKWALGRQLTVPAMKCSAENKCRLM